MTCFRFRPNFSLDFLSYDPKEYPDLHDAAAGFSCNGTTVAYRNYAQHFRFYTLIEWVVADVFFKARGDAYLGTQGGIWDAQKDIFLAFSGAIIATTIVSVVKKVFKVYEQ